MDKNFDIRKNVELIRDNYVIDVFEETMMYEFMYKINEDIFSRDNILNSEMGQEIFEQIVDSFVNEDSFFDDFMNDFLNLISKHIDKKRDEVKKKKEEENEKKEYLIEELSQVNSDEFVKIIIEVVEKRLDNK